jgi:CO/xanthine dehydrogenase FAD-binding subunit
MAEGETRVFRPRNLGGLLRLYGRNPDSLLFAGGTDLGPRLRGGGTRSLELPEKVIYLGGVAELGRISRSQRFLDIGACLSLSRIMAIGRNVLPPVLYQALAAIGTPSVRNLATLGGNLCAAANRGDVWCALTVIDAQLELRSLGGGRWVSAAAFLSAPERFGLRPGEVLSRVRVPLEEWDLQLFRKLGGGVPDRRRALRFAAVAHFPKGTVDACRFCFDAPALPLFRSPAVESRMKSARLPFAARETAALLDGLGEALDALAQPPPGGYVRATAVRLLGWLIEELHAGGRRSDFS